MRKSTASLLLPFHAPAWLEKGSRAAELNHLKAQNHIGQLTKYLGISEQDVPRMLRNIIRDGRIISSSGCHWNKRLSRNCAPKRLARKDDKQKMLDLLGGLNARLDEINDGSFTVEDLETPRVQSL